MSRYLTWAYPTADPLPWGVEEIEHYRSSLRSQVLRMVNGGVVLGGRGQTSEPYRWEINDTRAQGMYAAIDSWQVSEPVIADHKAEAIRIVYEGLVDAGVVPFSAYRKPRQPFRA